MKPRERDVTRQFRDLVGLTSWARVVNLTQITAKRGTALRKLQERNRVLQLEEYARWCEGRSFGVLLWRRNSSGLRNASGRPVVSGLPGEPDFDGNIWPGGRRVGVELKAPGGKPRPEQRAIREIWKACSAVYILADSADEALARLGAAAGLTKETD